MAILNAWQRIDRVIPGKPWGDGTDGDYSSATIPTLVKDSCSGSASSNTLTTAGSTFADGDLLYIKQVRGTGVGQWEINKVVSGGGTTSLTLKVPLNYTFTDSGASQAQAVKIFRYNTVNPSSGTWTVSAWDGNTGGILPIACKTSFAPTNTINLTGKGFLGGNGHGATSSTHTASQGEGSAADRGTESNSANASAGGGGNGGNPGRSGGGGGGNGASGSSGSQGSGQPAGGGGNTSGSSDLTTITFGGGGGAGGADSGDASTGGAPGGGEFVVFSKTIDISGATITNNGDNAASENEAGGGGGGAGGSSLLACETAVLGSDKLTSTAGVGGDSAAQGDGGNGGEGRIAIHHRSTVTGTTNPSFTDISDTTLRVRSGAGFFLIS